jgi:hypothetical protein
MSKLAVLSLITGAQAILLGLLVNLGRPAAGALETSLSPTTCCGWRTPSKNTITQIHPSP